MAVVSKRREKVVMEPEMSEGNLNEEEADRFRVAFFKNM